MALCHLDHHGRGEYDLDLEKKKKRSIINNDYLSQSSSNRMNYFAYSDFHHFPIIQHKRMNYFASDFYHFLILKKENGYFDILLNEWIIVDVANMI